MSMPTPMSTPANWRKSSYSGPDDGNNCVEIANSPTQVAIRDSKNPGGNIVTVRPSTFMTFAAYAGSLGTRGARAGNI